MNPRILVAGIGNIFLGDDAFGVEVAQRLIKRNWPEGVRVADYGIRGFDLCYALMDDYDAFILIDAAPRGEAPGTLYSIEIDPEAVGEAPVHEPSLDAHALDPLHVLQTVKAMGGRPKRVLLVGCEPQALG
ncbi:MAG TPA: hydrogenase maturation protease, partial [Bryobacteraceae bacterium]|nr:hydrogenase maturation protease [Bryobacteraceae bacterium]